MSSCATTYIIGETVNLPAQFTIDDVPLDPASMVCKVHEPSGLVVDISYTIIRLSSGNYRARFNADEIGRAAYEWIVSDSGLTGIKKKFFLVSDSAF